MSLFPLFNSIRVSIISSLIALVFGLIIAYFVSRQGRLLAFIADIVFTIPLILPPTVTGYLLLLLLGPNRVIGRWFVNNFSITLTMKWWSCIFAVVTVVFPLVYRTLRSSFDTFDSDIADSARSLGLSNTWIFINLVLPFSKHGIYAASVLSFARGLGEYGATSMLAGYIPQRTSTISTEVYSLWASGEDSLAITWILINVVIAVLVLGVLNIVERRIRCR